ncbi:MAG: hypothetical protein HOJ21_05020 [Alphaproteobacteria bacterium]|jgi:hypothetical protein|nr:hypothetical protein [Alphaproteobacteria bacterium]
MVRKTSLIVLTAASILAAPVAQAFTRERPMTMDAALGHDRVSEMETGVTPRRDENGVRKELRSSLRGSGNTAIGNLINIEAAPNSTIIVNATQINRGNQTALNGRLRLD